MSSSKQVVIPHSRPTTGARELAAVKEVLASGHLSQGPKTSEFEKSISAAVGRRFTSAVSSGTSALHLALLALGVARRDEVILPSYTCDALLQAVLYVGASPVIVDVDDNDFNISCDLARRAISKRTKAFIIPHTFGAPASAVSGLLDTGIPVVEDCAHTIGMDTPDGRTGSLGKVSAFSFYSTKYLATGEGGAVSTDDRSIIDVINDLRDYTGNVKMHLRFNYKLTDLQAAIGCVQMQRLPSFVDRRREIARIYTSRLSNISGVSFQQAQAGYGHSFYRFVLKLRRGERDKLRIFLRERGIGTGFGVLRALHQLLKLKPGGFPVSERLTKHVLSLPIYPSLRNAEIDRICKTINAFYCAGR